MGDNPVRGHMQVSLERIVAGLTAFVTDFDGPATAYVGSTVYDTLCSGGVKPQGEDSPYFGWLEAIEQYRDQLSSLIEQNKEKQLAWRCRPSLQCAGEDKYRVYSRLAFI
jgi:hypothetical protein